MTRHNSRRLMALAAGGDLTGRRRRRWEKHLADCAECRPEFYLYKKSIELAKSMARQEKTAEWSETEWRQVLDRAIAQDRKPERPAALRLPGWAWAGASGLAIVLIAGGTMLLRRKPAPHPVPDHAQQADVVLPEKSSVIPIPSEPAPGSRTTVVAARPGPNGAHGTARLGEIESGQTAAPAPPPPAPAVRAMTFVSQETGLTVHWIFNDSFNYEEEKK